MHQLINSLREEIEKFKVSTQEELEAYRLKYLSRKGTIPELFEKFKSATQEEKKTLGKVLNELKQSAEAKFKQLSEELESSSMSAKIDIDLSLPEISGKTGNLHPLNLTRYKIIEVFERLGQRCV